MAEQKKSVCSICSHPERESINRKISTKHPFRKIAAEYSVGRQSLVRHSRHMDEERPVLLCGRQAILAAELVKPQSIQQAMLNSGYSESSARRGFAGLPKATQKALRDEIQDVVSPRLLAERVLEGLNATTIKLVRNGDSVSKLERPDFGERRAMVELASKLAGYAIEKTTTETAVFEVSESDAIDRITRRLAVISSRKTVTDA